MKLLLQFVVCGLMLYQKPFPIIYQFFYFPALVIPSFPNFHCSYRFEINLDVINRFKTMHNISDVCNDEISCQLRRPSIFYTTSTFWLPVDEAPIIPSEKPILTLTDEVILNTPNTKRYNYTLTGPDHLTIFIGPKAPARIVNWSFDKTILPNSGYFISFVYGKDNKALEFFIDLELPANNSNSPNLEIGIAGNWVHQSVQRAEIYEEFLHSFPDYTTIVNWVATYDSWLF